MDSLRDLMQKRADEFDVDAKRDELAIAQDILSRHFKKGAQVLKLTENNSLIIEVNSAALASEIRLLSPQLRDEINGAFKNQQVDFIRTRVR